MSALVINFPCGQYPGHTSTSLMNFLICKSSLILLALSVLSGFNRILSAQVEISNGTASEVERPTLKNLILLRYDAEIRRSKTVSSTNIPGPLFLKHHIITDPEYTDLIDKFEAKPDDFYNESRLLRLVTFDTVRDYYTHEASPQIIDLCLSHAPSELFITYLFEAAILKNVREVVDLIINNESYLAMLKESLHHFYISRVIEALVKQKIIP